mmetsp:Transcript_4074/g.7146  ORF Transcript_4074/g.7146 Transcript_4074/m.7146 type:complete len:346 (+) Transcript_4074:93-1130(+)|eukprot:CAMPEP_0182448290 /NCGR_PEP_ID=MMETSP1172-20130603/25665_1 /TAXON_ID=708627 /ORGANISM="Timspurckia oligopyrenoides, Strain CCMP3278" /LENGTH=345 /DNA_ID=CAMNT_0024645095 /DNA_START=48 /DNA_END=1085 /DNA_ORIENTATION=+
MEFQKFFLGFAHVSPNLEIQNHVNSSRFKSISFLNLRFYSKRSQIQVNLSSVKINTVPDQETLKSVLEVAKRIAKEAGGLVKSKSGASVLQTKLNSKDLLTQVDKESQELIEARIKEYFPLHRVLGEESVSPGADSSISALSRALNDSKNSPWLWCIDPIDGTINFIHRMPLSAVSIGICYQNQLVIGVIYDPFHDELFYASKNNGAFLNNESNRLILSSNPKPLHDILACTGSPTSLQSIQPVLRAMTALMPSIRTFRLLGSAAIMMAWVAAGRVDCYFEPDLHSWDIAAGAVLLEESGGVLGDLRGSKFDIQTRALIASGSSDIHNKIYTILKDANVTGLDPI